MPVEILHVARDVQVGPVEELQEAEGAQAGPAEDLRVPQDVHVGPVEELQEARVQQGGFEHDRVEMVGVARWVVLSRLHPDVFYSDQKRNAW